MQIIGELLNSSIGKAKDVFERRDEQELLSIASAQAAAGAAWIDINAALLMQRELETLLWAGNLVLDGLKTGIAADSADPQILVSCAEAFGPRCLLNSVAAEEKSLGRVLSAAAQSGAGVIVMLKNDKGIPADSEGRMSLAGSVARAARAAGIPAERLYFDPIFQPLATGTELAIPLSVLESLAALFPEHQRVGGLSNVSFGLPRRRLVNRTFAAMAVSRYVTALICDPTDRGLIETVVAAESLVGLDPGCRRLLRYMRYSARDKV